MSMTSRPRPTRDARVTPGRCWTGSSTRLDSQLHLDSNTSAERFDAHRLYYNNGLAIRSHHFAREL
jgi:hypothetical protein